MNTTTSSEQPATRWPFRHAIGALVAAVCLDVTSGASAIAVASQNAATTDPYPGPGASFADAGPSTYLVPLLPSAADDVRQGFVRVANRSPEAGEVRIEAYDDSGVPFESVYLSIGANETVHFNSADLEAGNPDKGLSDGVGSGRGHWWLKVTAALNLEVLTYVRTSDGFLTSMHDVAPSTGSRMVVHTFNPGSNAEQVSRLRLINLGTNNAKVKIRGIDDLGASPGTWVEIEIPPHAAREFTAAQLESGHGELTGALGDGSGKWRLEAQVEGLVAGMSLLESPTGHLTNLSVGPVAPEANGESLVALFPSASDESGREGFLRLVNRSDQKGRVYINVHDGNHWYVGHLFLDVGPGQTKHLNSNDLAHGNASKGLHGAIGSGTRDWQLRVSSAVSVEVLAYIRTTDGFLTAIHGVAPNNGQRHHVAIFNPGSNTQQSSRLRVANLAQEEARLSITGIDDHGRSPGTTVMATLAGDRSTEFTAHALETGGTGFAGALGNGTGKWRLVVESDKPVTVASLLVSEPTGILTNLSTVSGRAANEIRRIGENAETDELIGAPITVDSGVGGSLVHELEGPDASAFVINTGTGQLTTRDDTVYDHEARSFHWVTVAVDDGNSKARIGARVEVTDRIEPPYRPNPPTGTSVTDTSMRLTWGPPANQGPPIVEYDHRLRPAEGGNWIEGTRMSLQGTEAIVEGLVPDASYEAALRASSDEGSSPWSEASQVKQWPPAPEMAVPGPWQFTTLQMDGFGAEDFDSFCVVLTLATDVYGRYPIYLSVLNQNINGTAFYGGLQTSISGQVDSGDGESRVVRRGRGAIFSRWGERDTGAIRPAPGGLSESGGYEGDFISVRQDYPWTRGSYRLCLVKGDVDEGEDLPDPYDPEDIAYGWGKYVHTWVRMEVTDIDTGKTTVIGALAFPGRRLSLGNGAAVFYEAYNRRTFEVRDVRSFDAIVERLQVDGLDVEYRRVTEIPNSLAWSVQASTPVIAVTEYRNGRLLTHVGGFTGAYGSTRRTLHPEP